MKAATRRKRAILRARRHGVHAAVSVPRLRERPHPFFGPLTGYDLFLASRYA